MKAALLLALPILALCANVCIWDYDTLDRIYEPSIADSVDCAYWVQLTLAQQGHTTTVTTQLPEDLSGFDIVFCLMGWFRC